MSRAKLVRHLNRHGCSLLREGAKHSIFRNVITGAQATVPRHKKLLLSTAQAICKQLGVPWPPRSK